LSASFLARAAPPGGGAAGCRDQKNNACSKHLFRNFDGRISRIFSALELKMSPVAPRHDDEKRYVFPPSAAVATRVAHSAS